MGLMVHCHMISIDADFLLWLCPLVALC